MEFKERFKIENDKDVIPFKIIYRLLKDVKKFRTGCFRRFSFHDVVRVCYMSRERHKISENVYSNIGFWLNDIGMPMYDKTILMVYLSKLINAFSENDEAVNCLKNRFSEIINCGLGGFDNFTVSDFKSLGKEIT